MAGLSARNPAVQHLRRLARRRSARSDARAFVIDGPTLVTEAFDASVEIETLFVDEAVAESDAGRSLIDLVATAGVRCLVTSLGVLEAATDTSTSQGIAAIARHEPRPLGYVTSTASGLVLVLAGVADPGNAGTLLRSAEAFGAKAVVVTEGSVDLYAPKTVRASAGSLFRVPAVVGGDAAKVVSALRSAGYVAAGTVSSGGAVPDQVDLTQPTAVVLGSEAHGLPQAVAELVDLAVTIPMAGAVESLNVAMAGTIVCYEAARQRRAGAQ